ncbi:MAG: cell wall-binding protein [Johnsonella sp.]|nr:cell wall-binding protein [Johnsonella sp.]
MAKKKFVRVLLLSALITAASAGLTMADEWQQKDGLWQYVDSEGKPFVSSWVKSSDQWYYLGEDGNMATDALIEDGSNYYYVNADGVMLRDQWVKLVDSENANFTYWYYFGSSGKAYKGKSGKLSTKEIGGKKYLFDENAKMITGLVTAEGERVDPDSKAPYVEAQYFFGDDGAMYQDQWHRYELTADDDLYSQFGMRNYKFYEEMWLYFDHTGKKVSAKSLSKSKVKEIGGKSYAFDENGIMIPHFSIHDTTVSAATSSDAKFRYGSLDTDGHLAQEFWTFTVPTEEMSEEDYHSQEFSWFRTRINGDVEKDKIAKVFDRKYAFDEIGRMQTGFVIMQPDGTFGKQFEVDAFSLSDFKDGTLEDIIPLMTRGNLYLFGTDELNDGSMRIGKDVTVVLSDQTATFGFNKRGVAYGNRGKLQKVDGKYYINGLLLQADPAIKYGIVEDNTRSGQPSFMVVVDERGNQVRGNKAILKDGDGNWILVRNGRFIARVADADKPRWYTKDGMTGFWSYDKSLKGIERYVELISFDTHGGNNLDQDFVIYQKP